MKKDKYFKLTIVVIILGAVLRLLWLGKIPSGFFRDEAALGYNAYSILKTGQDEFGMRLPLVFRSFEVFFLPAYVYLSVPIVAILGLTELSARLLSSLSGIGALIITFYIADFIWNKKTALISTFILAISPWHIFYSRGAFEGNLALTFFSLGFLFWLKFNKDFRIRNFLISVFAFASSMYSYQSERIVVVLFALIAVYLMRNSLWDLRKKIVLPTLAVFVFLLPLLSLSLKPGGYHRALGVSVLAGDENPPGWMKGIESDLFVNNKLFLRGQQITALYLSYFSPRNLFIEGDYNRQRATENYSVFYAWMSPFLAYGIYQSVKKRSKNEKLLFAWILLSPLPASLTGDPFHTYRSLLLYLPLTLVSGYGVSLLIKKVRSKYQLLFGMGFVLVALLSLIFFLFDYLVITPATRARAWDYGYREIIKYINDDFAGSRVVVDDDMTESYIHFLFFGKIDPGVYQSEVAELGDINTYYYSDAKEIRPIKIGNLEFRKVDWPSERGDSGTIFVMTAGGLPESEYVTDPKIELLKMLYYPDGKIAYKIVRVK